MEQSFLAALLAQAWKVSAGCAIIFSTLCGREFGGEPMPAAFDFSDSGQ